MSTTIDMTELKSKLKTTWMAGDYATFAEYMAPGAVDVIEQWGITPGESFLDVACGSGQLAVPAAERGAIATGVDIATNSIESARKRAAAAGVNATFDEGDAEDLPYADNSFDTVASIFGAMFAPRPELVAKELLRVCKPGGRVLMGNWTPQGFIGQMFKTIGKHIAPPAGMTPPPLWGDESTVAARFAEASSLTMTRRLYSKFMYPFSPAEVVDFFFEYYGPTNLGLKRLNDEEGAELKADLVAIFEAYNRGTDQVTLLEAEYLSVEAIK